VGENARFVSVAAAGDRLVYSQRIEDMDLWRMEGPGAAERDLPTKFPASSTRNEGWPQYSPDGTKVAFFSFRSGKPQIWISDGDGTNATRVTPQDEIALWPRWSPSGGRIAFVLPSLGSFSAQGSFNADIYLVDTKGGIPRNLTSDGFTNSFPNWSPDERWIYYSSTRTGDWQVWKIRTEGGQPKQVTKNGGHISFAADDGRNLYYSKHAPEEGIWSVPVDGGEETHLVAKPLHLGQWCLWRRNLVYVTLDDDKGPVVEAFHLTTRETTEAGPLGPQAQDPTDVQWTWFGLTVSPDGQWILYTEARLASDLMLVENFR
jgi:dipeptidyl aminopeptidase/acylaminoacyl peptidase